MGRCVLLPNTDNLIATATLTVASESASYPKANLAALPVAKAYRSTSDTGQSVLMDFPAPVAVDLAAIVGHNLTSAATITLKAGTTSAVSDFTAAIPWRDRTAYRVITTQTFEFWKIEIDDASNPDGFIEIGYIAIGGSTALNFGPLYGTLDVTSEFNNTRVESEYGAPHIAERFGRGRVEFDLRLETSKDSPLLTVLKELKTDLYPAFLIPDADNADGFFGRFQNHPARRFFKDIYRESRVEFLEDSPGRSIAA